MTKKLNIILILLILIALGGLLFWILGPKSVSTLQSPLSDQEEKITPSQSLTTYEDPSGFKFDYPDNLSIAKQETSDESIYSSLQLYSKQTDGSISLEISDTKLKNTDDWIAKNNYSTAQIKNSKLGSLDAKEIKTADRLYLVAIDKGILFSFEMPPLNESFWTPVFQKLSTAFSFGVPETSNTQAASAPEELVFFEGEETVE